MIKFVKGVDGLIKEQVVLCDYCGFPDHDYDGLVKFYEKLFGDLVLHQSCIYKWRQNLRSISGLKESFVESE